MITQTSTETGSQRRSLSVRSQDEVNNPIYAPVGRRGPLPNPLGGELIYENPDAGQNPECELAPKLTKLMYNNQAPYNLMPHGTMHRLLYIKL